MCWQVIAPFHICIGARVSAVAFLKNQKITESLCDEGREITHAQNQNPLTALDKILQDGRYPRRSYLHKFWWPSVKGFLVGGGQISPSPIDFHRRPYNTLALPLHWERLQPRRAHRFWRKIRQTTRFRATHWLHGDVLLSYSAFLIFAVLVVWFGHSRP